MELGVNEQVLWEGRPSGKVPLVAGDLVQVPAILFLLLVLGFSVQVMAGMGGGLLLVPVLFGLLVVWGLVRPWVIIRRLRATTTYVVTTQRAVAVAPKAWFGFSWPFERPIVGLQQQVWWAQGTCTVSFHPRRALLRTPYQMITGAGRTRLAFIGVDDGDALLAALDHARAVAGGGFLGGGGSLDPLPSDPGMGRPASPFHGPSAPPTLPPGRA